MARELAEKVSIPMRLSQTAFYSILAILGVQGLSSAELPKLAHVTKMQCDGASCTTSVRHIEAKGKVPANLAGSPLRLLVLDTRTSNSALDQKVVAGRDGHFKVMIPSHLLGASNYVFGVSSRGNQPELVAAGAFTIARTI